MPINETYAAGAYFKDAFVPALAERIKDIATAPAEHTEMIWILFPLIITMLLIEFYLGRYRDEELGWNTALGNSLVLVFVGIDLLRRIYGESFFSNISMNTIIYFNPHALLAVAVLSTGMIMILVDFFHAIPKSLAFVMSSPLTVNLTSYLAVIFIYSNLPLDFVSAIAAIIVFMAAVLIIDLIHMIEPKCRKKQEKTNVGRFIDAVLKKKG